MNEPDVLDFLRYIADPSRDFDLDQFDFWLGAARRSGYVAVHWKGQVTLTPSGLYLLGQNVA